MKPQRKPPHPGALGYTKEYNDRQTLYGILNHLNGSITLTAKHREVLTRIRDKINVLLTGE